MVCKECGTLLNEEQNFCVVCGKQVEGANNKETSLNNSYYSDFDESLLKSYIGNNADKILNLHRKPTFQRNSMPVLYFGILYYFYRKQWLLGLIFLIGELLLILIIPEYSVYVIKFVDAIMLMYFIPYYIKNARTKINKIKEENPNKSKEELMEICKKKGGTTILPIIGCIIVIVLILLTI